MGTGAGPLFGSNAFAPPTTGGSNQWMSYPTLPGLSGNPGGWGGSFGTSNNLTGGTNPFGSGGATANFAPTSTTPGNSSYVGAGYYQAPTYDPGFTGQFYQMLQSMIGGGGGQLQQNLLSFLNGGQSSIPGASSLTQMANTGDPISALPEWQAMVKAMGQNTQQNEAQLREQFASAGDLQSSPFGTAMSNYLQQTNLDQNALLGQLDTTAMENAMQRELSASQSLTGMAGAETQFLDQLFASGATASPNLFKKGSSSILGGIGSLLGAAGTAASGFGDLAAGLGAGGAAAGGAADIAGLLAMI